MATYLKFHELARSPFEGAGSDRLVLATEALRHAYAEIKTGLDEGSPRICVSGGPGIGKSSLARALPKLLAQHAQCVLVRDPSRDWVHVKATIVKQLGLEAGQLSRASLVNARRDGRRLVLVVDEAEQLPAESLEHLDVLLGYRDDSGEQLVHAIILASLEGAPRGQDVPLLWWLDQLTTRQLTFSPIPEAGLRSYIDKHLKKAGAADGSLFEDGAITAIHRYTGGVPGAVSALCEQLLDRAASRSAHTVNASLVASVFCDEPEPAVEEAPSLADAPERVESLIDHTNTPPPPEETESKGLPLFGERLASRSAPPPRELASPEPRLEVEQGLSHFESTNNHMNESDFFGTTGEVSTNQPEAPRFEAQAQMNGSGVGRVRQLIGAAVLAVLAVVLHATWSSWIDPTQTETPRAHARRAPVKPAAAADSGSIAGLRPLDLLERAKEVAQGSGEKTPEEPIFELEPEDGLTSDLRLGENEHNAAALDTSNGLEDQPELAAEDEQSLSLDQLYQIAEQAEDEGFQPWTQQAPETGAGAGTKAVPAAPAPPARPSTAQSR